MEVMGAFICSQADWLAAELKATIFNAPGNRPDARADIMWIIFIVSNILKPKHNVFEYSLFIHYANVRDDATKVYNAETHLLIICEEVDLSFIMRYIYIQLTQY